MEKTTDIPLPTSRCASQTAPEAQRKRNIRNAKDNYER